MRWIVVCLLVAAGFWYLSQPGGPLGPPADTSGNLDRAMQECMAKARYAASRMGTSALNAQPECAAELNTYNENGHWYAY